MKKIISILLFFSATIIIGQDIPKDKILNSSKKQEPTWLGLGDQIGEYDKKKVIFFTGFGKAKDQKVAMEEANLAGVTAAAAAIRTLATKQVAKAWEVIGLGNNEQKQQVMKGLEAISSKDVNVSGLIKVDVYWRHIITAKVDNYGKFKGWNQPMYEYYIRFALDYNTYIERRNAVIEKITKKDKKQLAEIDAVDEGKIVEKKKEETKIEPKEEKTEIVVEPKKKESEKKTGGKLKANFKSEINEEE